MPDREKIIKALECRLDINGSKYKHCLTCDYRHDIDHCQWACQTDGILEDALALLKAQEVPTSESISSAIECLLHPQDVDDSDMAKAIDTAVRAMRLLKAQEPATVEPKRIELADETKAWLDTMDAVEALGNIADICIDWDGYRTANGLGGLINEIWAYARYCAKKLNEAQEPVSVQKKPMEMVGLQTWDWACGNCGQTVLYSAKFCPWCGRKVKWE